MNRREFLRTAGGAAGAATATTAATGPAVAQEGGDGNKSGGNKSGGNESGGGGGGGSGPIDYKGWLDGAKGWDGAGSTVDKRGKKAVTIQVGVGPQQYAFKPVAVHVDPGTKITWKWKSSGHNVQAKNGEFKSKVKSSGTYEYTAEKKGVIPYFCQPHKGMGMKGALAVGNNVPHKSAAAAQKVEPHEMGVPLQPHYVGMATILAMMSTLVFTFYLLKYGESAHTKGGNN